MSKRGKLPAPAHSAIEDDQPEPRLAFELAYTLDAAAEIKKLDGSVRKQLKKVLEKKLAVDPKSYGSPLRGSLTNFWKHEFGSHRVIYRIYSERRIVAICAVGPRKQGDMADIYNQLEAIAETGRLAAQIASVLSNLPKNK
jgi:mRNA-degrading endonuclease RelE of RelBE toxin-antitoxin system